MRLVFDPAQQAFVDEPVEAGRQDRFGMSSDSANSSNRRRPENASRITSGVHQSPIRSVVRAIGQGQSSNRVRRISRLPRQRHRLDRLDRSMRARTCLCYGVPANQSRSSVEVSSFGATPTESPASPAGRRARTRWAARRARAHRVGDLDRGDRRRRAGRDPGPVAVGEPEPRRRRRATPAAHPAGPSCATPGRGRSCWRSTSGARRRPARTGTRRRRPTVRSSASASSSSSSSGITRWTLPSGVRSRSIVSS